jgi:PAS domain S-box-containing protein
VQRPSPPPEALSRRGQPPAAHGQPLAELAEVSPDLLATVASDGTLIAANPAWTRILGWDPQELVGQQVLWIVHEDDRAATARAFRELIAEGAEVVDFENRCHTRDGDWRWISWSGKVQASTGRLFASGRDVTARVERHLEVSTREALLAAAERIARIGSWEWTPAAGEVRCSPEQRRLLGLGERQDVTFGDFLEAVHPEDRAHLQAQLDAAIARREPYQTEYRATRPDGRERVVLERGEPAEDEDGSLRYFGTVQDVTEQRRFEAELRRALETEQEASERLRQLDHLKDSFLGAISHELRTPLTVLRGLAETLQRHDVALDAATRARIQDALVEQSTRLGDLVTDLLDLNRLVRRDETAASPSPIDLCRAIRIAVEQHPDASRVRLELPDRLEVGVDPLHVERIVVNLVDNANKYAPDGPVVIRLATVPEGRVRLEIQDQGPGIASWALERVFQPFYRADDEHPQPGTGVGLALVDEFARLHGGCAWAENPVEGGARIVVELPSGQPG